MTDDQKEYMTLDEAAESLGMKRPTIYIYMRELGIKAVKFRLDRRAFLSQADIQKIRELKEKPWLAGIDREVENPKEMGDDDDMDPAA